MGWLWTDYGILIGYAAFCIIASLIIATRRNYRQHRKSSEQTAFPFGLERPIERLLKSGIKDAYIKIGFENLDSIIFFQKYIRNEGIYGIVMLFPYMRKDDKYSISIQRYCEQNTLPFTIVTIDQNSLRADLTQSNEKIEAISIDFEQDCGKALEHLKSLVVDTLGISETTEIYHELKGGWRPGELVDSPEQLAFTKREAAKYWDTALRNRTGLGFFEATVFMILTLIHVFSYFAFMYSIIAELFLLTFSIHPKWSVVIFDVFGLRFQAKWFDIVWVALFLLTFLAPLTKAYWVDKLRKAGRDWRTVVGPSWRLNRADLAQALKMRLLVRWNLLIPLVLLFWVRF